MTAISPAADRTQSGHRFALGGTLAMLGAGAAMFAAPPADAALRKCSALGYPGSDPGARCAKVKGIRPGSSLPVRAAPRHGARVVNRLHNGDVVEVDCWAKGGDRYWAGLYGATGHTYVNEYFLTTGRVSVWTKRVPRC